MDVCRPGDSFLYISISTLWRFCSATRAGRSPLLPLRASLLLMLADYRVPALGARTRALHAKKRCP
eukprot:scaffold48_cov395-Prasinococcus_capsulatus_cf.AAC.9